LSSARALLDSTSFSQCAMKKQQMIFGTFILSEKSQQRLTAFLLGAVTGRLEGTVLICPCGKRADIRLRQCTLDIHHKVVGEGPKEREQLGSLYYAKLAGRFLLDIFHGTKFHERYELICRACHKQRHKEAYAVSEV